MQEFQIFGHDRYDIPSNTSLQPRIYTAQTYCSSLPSPMILRYKWELEPSVVACALRGCVEEPSPPIELPFVKFAPPGCINWVSISWGHTTIFVSIFHTIFVPDVGGGDTSSENPPSTTIQFYWNLVFQSERLLEKNAGEGSGGGSSKGIESLSYIEL